MQKLISRFVLSAMKMGTDLTGASRKRSQSSAAAADEEQQPAAITVIPIVILNFKKGIVF
jgi:hypothetical protein